MPNALDPRGSVWSKWDLHVHTPTSLVHQYPGSDDEAWEVFLTDLEALPPEFRVIGINDYLFLDGYERVLEERAQGRLSNIDLVLPVVEFRLNQFGGTDSRLSKVNFHVVFSDELQPQVIREQFLNALSSKFQLLPKHAGSSAAWSGVVTRDALAALGQAIIDSVPTDERSSYGTALQEGFNNLTLSYVKVNEALQSSFLRNRFMTAVGKTEWANVKWKDGSIADKKHVINSVDWVFTAAESARAYGSAMNALVDANVNHRLLDCSDAHSPSTSTEKDRIGNCMTWIKADPTFGGLLQAHAEFGQRVFVGEEPAQLRRVNDHPSKYIERVRIAKTSDSTLSEEWFAVDLPLNSGLVAVIGNKGSGKSALAEVIGLVGGSPHEEHFSFLTDSKFRDARQRLAANFEGELKWHRSEESDRSRLSISVTADRPRKVQHLPQRYLETLCNEVPSGGKSGFDAELERIIFAHLPADQRLGTQSLQELNAVVTGSLDTALAERRQALHTINTRIATLEQLLERDEIQSRRLQYVELRNEWLAFQRNPPVAVPEPDEADPNLVAVRGNIRELEAANAHLTERLKGYEDRLSAIRRDQADLTAFRTRLEALKRQHDSLIDESSALLERVGLSNEVSNMSVDAEALDAARSTLAAQEGEILEVLHSPGSDERALREVVTWIEEESDSLRGRLSAPEEAREAYVNRRAAWEQEVLTMLGDRDSATTDTVLGARRAYHELFGVTGQIELLRQQRLTLAGEMHGILHEKASQASQMYEPLQQYVDGLGLPTEYQVSVGTSLVDTSFADVFLGELINRHAAGSFCGIPESERRLAQLLGGTDFDDKLATQGLLATIDEHLRKDVRQESQPETVPRAQVRKGKTLAEVYDWIFGLSWLSPRYGLLFGDKPIHQLSPGEKGTLLLVFFLIAEVDLRPLLIDQPEDNLDNNTVYRALVHCFRKAKERRQVVIVTHNPNLAVVCDADQIVVASMDKSGANRITYAPGAIERRDTVGAVVDILEGTQPAFSNRSLKYNLHLLQGETA